MNTEKIEEVMKLVYRVRENMFSAGYASRCANTSRAEWAESLSTEAIDQIRKLLEAEAECNEAGPATYIIGFPGGEYTEIKNVYVMLHWKGDDCTLKFHRSDPREFAAPVAAVFLPGSWAWFGKKDEQNG